MSIPSANTSALEVSAPARLHLGFLDLNGGLGRRFGSIGVAVEGFDTRLRVGPADDLVITGGPNERIRVLAERMLPAFPRLRGARVDVLAAAPEHAGLGSGTQLALSLGSALAQLAGERPSAEQLAVLTGRGRRSGIGIAAFEQGGFVIDGGHGIGTGVPPVIARIAFPEDWRFLLLLDTGAKGLSGRKESDAFSTLPAASPAHAAEICRSVLMQLLPGILERDFGQVAAALRLIQDRVGDYFAPQQGGRYTSERVAAALRALSAGGVVGLGQSSWGPTGFALFENADGAEAAAATLTATCPDLRAVVCSALNHGATVESVAPATEGPSLAARAEG